MHDFLKVLFRRWRLSEVLIIQTRVQGEGAHLEVAQAIAMANLIAGVDVVVVTRGGGSIEDLWTFNEEIVARAIFALRLPVISAIGHEVDYTIADLTADLRAQTPTDAAALCVPDLAELNDRLFQLQARIVRTGQALVDDANRRIDRLAERAKFAVERSVEQARLRFARIADRPLAAIKSALEARMRLLTTAAGRLEALSPLAVLARGYSVTTLRGSSVPIRNSSEVRVGDLIETRFANGTIASQVIELPKGASQ